MTTLSTPYDDVTIAEVSSDAYDNDGVVVQHADGREIMPFLAPEYASGVDAGLISSARDHVVALRSASVMEALVKTAEGIVADHTGGSEFAMERLEAQFRRDLGNGLGQSVADLLRQVLDGQALIHKEVPYVVLDRTDEDDADDDESPAP